MPPVRNRGRTQYEIVLKRAEQGNAEAQCNLGRMLRIGRGVEQDEYEAAYWLFKAVQQGHAEAAHLLGQLFRDKLGFEQEEADAARWWFRTELQAAETGDIQAQFNVGRMYREGRGVARVATGFD